MAGYLKCYLRMKKGIEVILPILFFVTLFSSCDMLDTSRTYTTLEKIEKVKNDLANQFGAEAGYGTLSFVYDDNVGTIVLASGTDDFSESTALEKRKMQGFWEDVSEITYEIEGDGNLKDYLFTMDELKLERIPGLIDQSKVKLVEEKDLDDMVVNTVFIDFPDNKPRGENIRYFIDLEPENGGTTFKFIYDHNGALTSFDY